MEEESKQKKVVIIGGGIGGLETALSLKRLFHSSANITLIDRQNHQSFLPSIHEAISGKIRPKDIEFNLEPVLKFSHIGFLQDEVHSLDLQNRKVVTKTGEQEYDYLVLACGAEVNFYGIKGADEYTHLFRSPEQAEKIYRDVKKALHDGENPCKIIIAGGGLEGIEIAGELFDLIREEGLQEDLESGRVTVEIIEGNSRLLPECDEKVKDFAEDYLKKAGTLVTTGTCIAEVQDGSVILDSGVVREMSVLIWTGGIKAAQWLQDSPLSIDKRGWLNVDSWLRSPDHNNIFALGDVIAIQSEESPLPRVATHALDQARLAALNIFYDSQGRSKFRYYPKSKPQLISMGKKMGVMSEGNLMFSGSWVVGLKKLVEKRHLWTYQAKSYAAPVTEKIPGAEFRHMARMLMPF